MPRPDKHILAVLRALGTPPADSELVVADTIEARILGLVPYTPKRMRDQSMNKPEPVQCSHEDTRFECPFCGGDNIDTDTHVCLTCKEPIAFVRRCLECEEDVTAFWPYLSQVALDRATAHARASFNTGLRS